MSVKFEEDCVTSPFSVCREQLLRHRTLLVNQWWTTPSDSYLEQADRALLMRLKPDNMEGKNHRVTALRYSQDGQEILASYSSDYLYLFDTQVGSLLKYDSQIFNLDPSLYILVRALSTPMHIFLAKNQSKWRQKTICLMFQMFKCTGIMIKILYFKRGKSMFKGRTNVG